MIPAFGITARISGSGRRNCLSGAHVFIVFILLAMSAPARAQEAQPGDACSTANAFRVSGGPETAGKGFTMTCQGGVWVRITESDTGGNVGVKQTAPKAPLHVGGEAIIGPTTGLACDADRTGGIRWSSASSTFEMCDGSAWKLLLATGGTGTPSTPPTGTGYFVLSNGTSTGGMGGSLAAADALCLTDLQTNDWLNKADATNRGILKSSNVQAFFCMNGSTCNNPLANTTYTFAASGSPSTGGATFTTDGSGQGPGNIQNWSGTNYFGGNHNYWTHRSVTSSSLWGTTVTSNSSCNGWSAGGAGNSNNTNGSRFNAAGVSCSTNYKYICMVHPGNETPLTPGYFVLTNSTWNGNLGGISGANAKCLTELTTNTNWKGYATANSNGQLVASKVKAFICNGTTNEGGTNTCNHLMANQTYSFAKVGDSNAGGASFTTDSNGWGPQDTGNWSGANYFSGTYTYWTTRNDNGFSNSIWGNSEYYACNAYTNSSSNTGMTGTSSSTGYARWKSANSSCTNAYNLICYVNP